MAARSALNPGVYVVRVHANDAIIAIVGNVTVVRRRDEITRLNVDRDDVSHLRSRELDGSTVGQVLGQRHVCAVSRQGELGGCVRSSVEDGHVDPELVKTGKNDDQQGTRTSVIKSDDVHRE